MEENLPPGFRFHPTDEELITYYLAHKLSDFAFTTKAIADVDLNKCEPWDLPGKANMGGKEWYFFSLRDRKYPTGLRTNRATDAGYWKTTGKDKEIFHCGVMVGMKKTLVFYKGRAPKGEKTNWVMHEYRHLNKSAFNPTKDEWVVSRVFRKTLNGKKLQQSMAAAAAMSPLMDSPCDGATTSAGELTDMDLSILRNIIVNSSSSPFNGVSSDNPRTCTNIIAEGNGRTDLKKAYINWLLNREAMSQLPAAATAPWSSSLASSAALLRALQLSHGYPANEMPSSSSFNSVSSGLGFPSFESGSDPSVVNMNVNVNVNAPRSSQMLMFEQHEAFDQEALWKSC